MLIIINCGEKNTLKNKGCPGQGSEKLSDSDSFFPGASL